MVRHDRAVVGGGAARGAAAVPVAGATLPADDPSLLALAEEAERLSRRMAAKASVERELVEEIVDGGGRDSA